MNITYIKSIAFLTTLVGMFSCSQKKQEIVRPNILFIMSDDHTQQALHAYGKGLLDTVLFPNMNRLAYPDWHMVKRHYGVRTDRYKLIHFYYDVDEWEMYDLETDPHEMQSVYDEPAYSDIQDQLHKKLEELREKYGNHLHPGR